MSTLLFTIKKSSNSGTGTRKKRTPCILFALLVFFTSGMYAQTADFSINIRSGCVPLGGVNFTDASSGGTVVRRDWNLGNGTLIANGPAVVGTNYLTAQTFNVSLTVTFSNGAVRTKTDIVVVHPKPFVDFSVNDTAGCVPYTANFTDLSTTTTGTINTWTWDFGAGGSTTQNPSFVYNSPGLYNISLIVKNSWGCESDAATKFQYVHVWTRPTAAFTPNPAFSCLDTATIFFNNTTTNGSPANQYLWDFGDGSTSTLKNPAHFYAAPGTYTVTLTASVGSGCSAVTTRTVYIGKSTPSFVTAPDTVCVNTSTQFTGTGTPAPYYVKWIFSDNNANQFYSPTNHTFATPGDYTVTLIAYTLQGCTDTISKPIHVKYGAGLVPFFITAPDTVCANSSTSFDGSANPLPARVQWFFTDNNSLQNNSPTNHTFATPGDFNVLLIAYNAEGCADTASKVITVKSGPLVNFTPDKVNGCGDPFTVTFTNSTYPNGDLRFTWNFGDGSPAVITTDTLPVVHTYSTFGNFSVSLTATDTVAGCVSNPRVFNFIRNYQPAVNFTYVPPDGCRPLPVKFTGQVSNLIVPIQYYVWNYGDGNIDSIPATNIANHVYTAGGIFNPTLTIVTAECSFTSIPKSVTVIDICDDDGSGGGGGGGGGGVGGGGGGGGFGLGKTCADKYTVDFTDTVSNTVVQSWDFGDGSPLLNTGILNPVSHTFAPPQKVYVVTVVRLDTLTNQVDTGKKRVIIIDEKADFVPDKTDICTNGLVNFSTVGIDSSKIKTYTWDFGDSTARLVIDNLTNFNNFGIWLKGNTSHTYIDTGLYYVKLIIEDKLGCADSIIYPVPVSVRGPIANFVPDIQLSCLVPLKVIFTDSSVQNGTIPITEWRWTLGNGSPVITSTQDTAVSSLYTANTYNVTLRVTDSIGCFSTITKQLVVPLVTSGPQAGFEATPLTSCTSLQNFVINDTSVQSGSVPIVKWEWNFGDGSTLVTDTDSLINKTYLANNYYNFYTVTLRITDSFGCVSTVTKPNYIKVYKPRAEFFSYDTLKCGAFNVFLYNNSQVYNGNYTWYYGDGTSSTGFYGSRTYAAEGNYNIKLVVQDENGCMDSITKTSYIKLVRPDADFKIGDTTRCAPTAIIFADSSTYSSSWEWDFGDGGTGSTAQNPSPKIYALPGFYKVTLRVTGLNNCKDSISKWIRVRGPIATLTANTGSGCKPYTIGMSVNGSFINTYAWDYNDGTPVLPNTVDSNVTHTYFNAGRYLPNVVLTSPEGCPFTLKAVDTVFVDSVKAGFVFDQTRFCDSGYVNFTDQTAAPFFSAVRYRWHFGDGTTDTTKNPPPHLYNVPGVYTVKLVVTSKYGCTDSFTVANAVSVYASPSAVINGSNSICLRPGSRLQYTAPVMSADAITRYRWSIDADSVANTPALNYDYRVPGNHVLTFFIQTVNGCTFSITKNIIIDSIVTDFAVAPARFCGSGTASFNNLTSNYAAIDFYNWSFGNGNTSTLQSPSHDYLLPGDYTVRLIAATINGCRDTTSFADTVRVFHLPSATISGNNIVCLRPGTTLQYTSAITSVDAIARYRWSIDADSVANTPALDYDYRVPGNHVLTFFIQTVNGCTFSITKNIIIDSIVTDFAVAPARFCGSGTASFNNLTSNYAAIDFYNWSFGDGNTSTLQSPSNNYLLPGSYTASLIAVTINGCRDTTSFADTVRVFHLPSATISGNDIVCLRPGTTLQYTSTITSVDAIARYRWSIDADSVANTPALDYDYRIPGNHVLTFFIQTVNGCTFSITKNIIIDSIVTDFAVAPARFCGSGTASFNNLTSNYAAIDFYNWSFGDGNTSTLQSLSNNYLLPGNYTASLIAVTINGCRDTTSFADTVRVFHLPSATISGNDIVCLRPGTTLQYTSTITSVDAIARYRWSIDADSVANTPALDYDYRIPGNHVLTLFIQTVNGCTFSVTKNIIIDSILTNFSIDQNKFCDNGTVQFTNLSTAAYPVLYNWSFGDGDSYNGVDTTHSYLNPGDYTVKLWGTTQNGCADSTVFTDTIHVYNLPVASIVGDSIHCSPGTRQYLANINSVDNIARYQWFVDAVERVSNTGLNYTFNAGNHVVGLKVTTGNGCTDSVARSIIVDSVKALFSISQAKFCGDTGRVQFTDNTERLFAISKYEWSFGDNTVSSLPNPLHTYQPGVYDVQLEVVTEHGCADTLLKPAAIEVYRNPVAAFTGDSIHCTPGNYRYFSTSTANDAIAQYEWKVNTVNAGVTDTLDHHFVPAGLYAVQLTVTTDKGCADDSIRQVVIDSVSAAFRIVNPRICGDTGTVRFNNLSGSRFGNRIYEWNFGDGQSSAETDPAHFYAAAGRYIVSLKASTAFGCTNTVISTDTVIIYRTTTAAIAGTDEKCMQHTLVYRPVIVTEDTVTAFTWRLNNTIISTADTMLYDFTTAGNYTVSLNVKTRYGCDVLVNKPVVIHPLPVPAAAPDTTICLGGTVLLRSYDGTSYQWEASPSLQNINTSTPLATPAATTDYFVTVTNQFGCVQKDTVTVKVDAPVGLTVSASDSLCFGERRQLRATSTVNNYLWSPAATLTSATDDDPFATPDSTTTYRVIAFSNNVCKTDTGYVTIFVGYRPEVSAGADRNVANGTPIQLTASVTGNDISSILWTPSTGLDCTACADPKLVADDNITYTVTVATTFGCSNSDNVRIVVFCGKGQLYIPNAFSPDGNGKNDVFYIKGYGIARIKRMMIFNRYGQKVFEKQNVPVNDPSQGWKGETGTQPPSGTAAYVYVLEVICKDGQEFSYKGTIMLVK